MLELVRKQDWKALEVDIERDPKQAQVKDEFGLLILHWVCMIPCTASYHLLGLLLHAYPEGAQVATQEGLIPLQLLIFAKANEKWIKALLCTFPAGILRRTTSGATAEQLGKIVGLSAPCMEALDGMHMLFDSKRQSTDKFESKVWSSGVRETELTIASTISERVRPVQFPPRWKKARNCYLCRAKFGAFRRQHHCRNCGESICRDHTARKRMPLSHFGLDKCHRVCIICCDTLISQISDLKSSLPDESLPIWTIMPEEDLESHQVRLHTIELQKRVQDFVDANLYTHTPHHLTLETTNCDSDLGCQSGSILALDSDDGASSENSFGAMSFCIQTLSPARQKEVLSSQSSEADFIGSINDLHRDDSLYCEDLDTLVHRGHRMLERGDHRAAIEAFREAVELSPDDATLYAYLGEAYYADTNFQASSEALIQSLDRNPNAAVCTVLGKVFLELGQHEKAIKAFKYATKL